MFDFFSRRTAKELMDEAKEKYILPEETKIRPKEPDEYFRVGATNDGRTTLTFIGAGGTNMTLTMNRDACEQMIRMLRATYTESTPTEGDEDA